MAPPQEAISFQENVPTQINIPPGTFYSFLHLTSAKPPPNHKSFLPNVPVRSFGTGVNGTLQSRKMNFKRSVVESRKSTSACFTFWKQINAHLDVWAGPWTMPSNMVSKPMGLPHTSTSCLRSSDTERKPNPRPSRDAMRSSFLTADTRPWGEQTT